MCLQCHFIYSARIHSVVFAFLSESGPDIMCPITHFFDGVQSAMDWCHARHCHHKHLPLCSLIPRPPACRVKRLLTAASTSITTLVNQRWNSVIQVQQTSGLQRPSLEPNRSSRLPTTYNRLEAVNRVTSAVHVTMVIGLRYTDVDQPMESLVTATGSPTGDWRDVRQHFPIRS
jgi:hypothetical protein